MDKISLGRIRVFSQIEPANVRDALYSAYVNERGIPSKYETPAIIHSTRDKRVHGKEALGILSLVGVTEQEAKRYQVHGLAIVTALVDPNSDATLIDVFQLWKGANSSNQPRYMWVKNRSEDCLDVLIASGKQHAPHDAMKLDLTRTLEGVLLNFDFKVNPFRQITYDERLTPLYGGSIQNI